MIAESAIHTRAQGAAAELAGADAILVGTALMQAADPPAKLREIASRPLVKVCGLTREEDVEVAVEAGADLCGFILEPAEPAGGRRGAAGSGDGAVGRRLRRRAGRGGADLVQLYEREDGKVRGRDAVLLRDGEQVATVVDLPWEEEDDPTHLERARAVEGRLVLAGGLGAGERAAGDRGHAAVGRRRELEARGEPGRQGSRARCARSWRRRDDRAVRRLRRPYVPRR